MKINIREWIRHDLFTIGSAWLDYCRKAARSDMHLKPDCETAIAQWLVRRNEDPRSIGYIAEKDANLAGFLIGRIDEWESIPPVVEPRRLGIIDAVYVVEQYRRQGIAGQLIQRAIQRMRDENAIAVEAIYEASSDPSLKTWRAAGFAPWMVHAYRML